MKLSVMVQLIVLAFIPCSTAQAQEAAKSLASEARDPTASILALNLRYDLTADFHKLDNETLGAFLIQPVIPFKIGSFNHIARISLPFITHTPSLRIRAEDIDPGLPSAQIRAGGKSGLSDTVLLDVITFGVSKGRLGVGPVMSIPTATHSTLGSKKWTLGPSGVAILREGRLQYGGLLQGFFTFAGDSDRDDVNSLSLQPFATWSLPNDWGIGFSEMSYVYDFERGKWTNLPLGLSLEKLIRIGSRPVRTFVQLEYNFQDRDIAPQWTLRFNFAPLFPLGGS